MEKPAGPKVPKLCTLDLRLAKPTAVGFDWNTVYTFFKKALPTIHAGTWEEAPGIGCEPEDISTIKNAPRQSEFETVPPIRSLACIVYDLPPNVRDTSTLESQAKGRISTNASLLDMNTHE